MRLEERMLVMRIGPRACWSRAARVSTAPATAISATVERWAAPAMVAAAGVLASRAMDRRTFLRLTSATAAFAAIRPGTSLGASRPITVAAAGDCVLTRRVSRIT
ncbi:MAG: hypothetical protein ACRDMZ_09030, partial [Solirubrobacteraceae bacterium]